jgi:hypothetical protein
MEEEKKLKLYHDSILKTKRENWGEVLYLERKKIE